MTTEDVTTHPPELVERDGQIGAQIDVGGKVAVDRVLTREVQAQSGLGLIEE